MTAEMTVSVSDLPTVRFRSSFFRVVLVRDDTRAWQPLADVLMTEFVVRLATNASEMVEHLKPVDRLACICVLSDTVRMRDVHGAALLAGIEPERIVFVAGADVEVPAALDDLVHVVRRLRDQRSSTNLSG
jgi:hypothetical protein